MKKKEEDEAKPEEQSSEMIQMKPKSPQPGAKQPLSRESSGAESFISYTSPHTAEMDID